MMLQTQPDIEALSEHLLRVFRRSTQPGRGSPSRSTANLRAARPFRRRRSRIG